MGRYQTIINNMLEIAKNDPDCKAIVSIGSYTRETLAADEYSDLDVIIATEHTEKWLQGNYPDRLGNIKISFAEPTLGGGKERRVLYEGALDVDMIIFTPKQFETAIMDGAAGWVMNRGYRILYDNMGCTELLKQKIIPSITYTDLSEDEFTNLINDFFFHTVWAAKKILRGELWSAKMCIDAYLKNHLLRVMEEYCVLNYQVDVWHDGRFLDRWAGEEITEKLKTCFAHYDKEDMVASLLSTKELFGRLAAGTAERKGYSYPEEAADYAGKLLGEYFG